MKRKSIQVYEVDPEEFKNEILAGVEKLLKDFSEQFTPKHPEIWMNRKEVGELLGISLVTIHNWSKNGILKAYKIGNRVRFRRSDIEQAPLLFCSKKYKSLQVKKFLISIFFPIGEVYKLYIRTKNQIQLELF